MTLHHLKTGNAEIAYTDSGNDGEPMLLMHGGGLADFCTPLADAPALKNYRVIRLVRAGYTGAQVPDGLTVGDHAAHAAALLEELGAGPAHVTAHSSGCAVAMQLAIDRPDLVRSLSLIEPPLVEPLVDPAEHEMLRAVFGPVIGASMAALARYDFAGAFDAFMGLVCGPDFHHVMVDVLGEEIVEDARNHSGTFFASEVPALNMWTVAPEALAGLRPPVLLIQGGESLPAEHRLIAWLAGRIPGAEVVTLDGANHLMPLTRPAEVGHAIDTFLS